MCYLTSTRVSQCTGKAYHDPNSLLTFYSLNPEKGHAMLLVILALSSFIPEPSLCWVWCGVSWAFAVLKPSHGLFDRMLLSWNSLECSWMHSGWAACLILPKLKSITATLYWSEALEKLWTIKRGPQVYAHTSGQSSFSIWALFWLFLCFLSLTY